MISIIIPVYNEEAGVGYLRERLAKVRELWRTQAMQFVIVDDGSSDGTSAALTRWFGGDPDCLIATHEVNRGIGAAFRTGFGRAGGSIVCTIDADCSYGPENLRLLVDALDREHADIAIASPYHPDGHVEGVPAWRLLLSRTCSLFYRILSPVRLYTYTSVFRAYRRAVIEQVEFQQDGFVSAVELLIRAARQGFVVVEIPMTLRARKIGTSKMKIVKTIGQHLSMMLSSIVRKRQVLAAMKVDNDLGGCAKAK